MNQTAKAQTDSTGDLGPAAYATAMSSLDTAHHPYAATTLAANPKDIFAHHMQNTASQKVTVDYIKIIGQLQEDKDVLKKANYELTSKTNEQARLINSYKQKADKIQEIN